MSDIVLSAGVRSNLLQLQQTGTLITLTQNRLATGKRVNSALDNPTNYFTAQGLQSRASDLSSLLDAQSNAIQTIQAANNGISAITKLVQSAQATARQAQQTTDTAERTSLGSQFDDILDPDRPARGRLQLQRQEPVDWRQPGRGVQRDRAPRS